MKQIIIPFSFLTSFRKKGKGNNVVKLINYAIIKVKAMIYLEDSVNVVKPLIVGKFRHHKKDYFASYLDIAKEYPTIKLREWTEVEYSFLTPNIRHSTDDLQVFGWLMGTGSFIIDDLTVIVYNEK